MTLRDLRNYTIVRSRPLQTQFRGKHKIVKSLWEIVLSVVVCLVGSTVLSMPPPASGAVLISILNIMGGYDGITNDTETYHRLVEVINVCSCLFAGQLPQLVSLFISLFV